MHQASGRAEGGRIGTNGDARVLVLWDIDNTLLYTGGAGSIGMRRAFADLYAVEDAFGRVEFSGRTDTAIFREAARLHGITEDRLDEEQARFVDAYIPHLQAALVETTGALMPGVAEVLEDLASRPHVRQALGTGNFRRGGELKLRHYGIDRHFLGLPGGFGEDSESRQEMIGGAIRALADGAERIVVIGDTPHDVSAALTNGAFALAVATGRDSVDDLLACGAHVAMHDLSDVTRAVEFVLG